MLPSALNFDFGDFSVANFLWLVQVVAFLKLRKYYIMIS